MAYPRSSTAVDSGSSLVLRSHESIADIEASTWDALDDTAHPFTRHAFLDALEASGSVREEAGWNPRHLSLWRDGELIAAAPAYLKYNSHGEFVFDHAWAHAANRAGIDYYPKLLLAVPYSPVNGPRLLARDAGSRIALATALGQAADSLHCSGVHVNFGQAQDMRALDASGFISRQDVQFHWRNDVGWRDWNDFSSALNSKRRKNIRHERERLSLQGWRFERFEGAAIRETTLDVAFEMYQRTFAEKYNHAALTRDFFTYLHAAMPEALMIVLATGPDSARAAAVCVQSAHVLYGRYWGSEVEFPGLHFETCYYQGIEHCLASGRTLFEPGAQGEHKQARGFLPVITESRHLLLDTRLHRAVDAAMAAEREQVAAYRRELLGHSPFAATSG